MSTSTKSTINTRTAEGRNALDALILKAVRKATRSKAGRESGVAASALDIGATPVQRRQSLNRLIGAGLVEYSGKARGTRYWAI